MAYWETYDGSQIRELDGSESGGINGMDVYREMFATGSSDKLVKLWLYEKGCVTHTGRVDTYIVHVQCIFEQLHALYNEFTKCSTCSFMLFCTWYLYMYICTRACKFNYACNMLH